MINATDLRIGNRILNAAGTEIEVTVEAITDIALKLRIVNGIPLTPEILLKCKFKKGQSEDDEEREIYDIQVANNTSLYFDRHKNWMRNDEEVVWYLSYEWNNNHYKNDFWAAPQYLHQLQNLYFALTGEELKYNHE